VFPVKKSISVGTRIQVGRAGCGQFGVLCGCGAKQTSKDKQGLGAGCGYILHPSFGLVLGLVLRERIKSKG